VGLTSEVAPCPASKHASSINPYNVDRPRQRRPHRYRPGTLRPRHSNSRFTATDALEGTVLRVPSLPSSRLRAFWRSSARRAGPPGLTLGSGHWRDSAFPRVPPPGRVRLVAPAVPSQCRGARCAPECAHALEVVAHVRTRHRVSDGSSGSRRPAGTASGSAITVKVIANNQARDAGTFQPRSGRFETSQNVPFPS
jgi:hypothetical protein